MPSGYGEIFEVRNSKFKTMSSCSRRHGTTCSGAGIAPPPELFAARSDLLLIFQDCADADNFPAVADLLLRAPTGGGSDSIATDISTSRIHIGRVRTRVALCVVGRRAHLGASPSKPLATPPSNTSDQNGSSCVQRTDHVTDTDDDEDADSHLCLLDGARRMRAFLQRVGVWARVDWFVVDPAHFGTHGDRPGNNRLQ